MGVFLARYSVALFLGKCCGFFPADITFPQPDMQCARYRDVNMNYTYNLSEFVSES